MFTKQLLISFIYELVEIFYFSDQIVQKFYQKYLIEKVYMYHVSTDTESVCLKFVFVISSTDSDIPAGNFRDIILGVIAACKMCNKFGSSNIYSKKFRKENQKKYPRHVETQHIDNQYLLRWQQVQKNITSCLKMIFLNQKYNGIKKGSSEIDLKFFLTEQNLKLFGWKSQHFLTTHFNHTMIFFKLTD